MQQIPADAAELGGEKPHLHSLADLLGLCLVTLAFASELSIAKDPAGMAAMASRLADSLSDAILKVCRLTILASCDYRTSSCLSTNHGYKSCLLLIFTASMTCRLGIVACICLELWCACRGWLM